MKFVLALFLFSLILPAVYSQETDTVALARQLADSSDLDSADLLLSSFNAGKSDLGGLWLHAQVLYWKREFGRSARVYKRALAEFPGAWRLHLDYGRTLWERGKLYKAQAQLLQFIDLESRHPEANLLLAYIEYWNGSLQKAQQRSELLLKVNPDFTPALELIEEIHAVSAPWMKLGAGYFCDDQPMAASLATLETGQYASGWMNPVFQFQFSRFGWEKEDHPFFVGKIQDNVYIGRTRTRLELTAGILGPLDEGAPQVIGGIALSQPLPAHFLLELDLEKRPYLYTLQSIQSPFTENFLGVALRFDHSGKWLGKAALEWQAFPDDNFVQTSYAWFLAPLLDRKGLRIQAGYAYSFADADRNRFRPLKPYNPAFPPENPVPGIFDPYFTPANQQIHSLLASIRLNPVKNLRITASTSAGVSAKADIPYFYPGLDYQGKLSYVKYFVAANYSPLEINGEIRLGLGRRSSLSAKYTFQRLLFYTNHYGGLQFQYQWLP